MWRKETITMSTDQNPKDQPLPKRKLRDPSRRKYIKPSEEPRPKTTHLLLLVEKLKTDKK